MNHGETQCPITPFPSLRQRGTFIQSKRGAPAKNTTPVKGERFASLPLSRTASLNH